MAVMTTKKIIGLDFAVADYKTNNFRLKEITSCVGNER
jgi:hypothetical protein